MSTPSAPDPPHTRARRCAKQACKVCNARRVRCNVTTRRPCDNCILAECECELTESKRGKYGRNDRPPRPAKPISETLEKTSLESLDTCASGGGRSTGDLASLQPLESAQSQVFDVAASSNYPSEQRREEESAVYLGESTSLRYVHDNTNAAAVTHHISQSNTRLRYPIPDASKGRILAPSSEIARKTARIETLKAEGAFDLPTQDICEILLQAYFQWFHPCFPIVDKERFIMSYQSKTTSPLLFQSMLFIGVIHCDEEMLRNTGLGERHDARYLFYNRAKTIYDVDYETDAVKILQALFLMSFWRAGPLHETDTRHWLGAAISLAQSKGMHRSSRNISFNQSQIGKRIWWSLYIRDRQCSAALGLPNRIRDEDYDIEGLEISDFDEGPSMSYHEIFGRQTLEHIHYVIEMAKLAKLLGKLVLTEFLPKTVQNVDRCNLRQELLEWESNLPKVLSSEVRMGTRPGLFAHMLHMAYKYGCLEATSTQKYPAESSSNLYILLYRSAFLKTKRKSMDEGGQLAYQAACRNTAIVEDLLSQDLVQHGKLHLITSLFNSLCIHTLDIRRSEKTARQVAEHRAKLCLLGLKELQRTWEVTNWVLQLFFQFLDRSIARRLPDLEYDEPPQNLADGPLSSSSTGLCNQANESTVATWLRGFSPSAGTLANDTGGGMQRAAMHNNHNANGGLQQPQAFGATTDTQDNYFYHFQPLFGHENGVTGGTGDMYSVSLNSLNGVSALDMDYLARCL